MSRSLNITQIASGAISDAFRKLLSDKHLYQRVSVDFTDLDAVPAAIIREAQKALASRTMDTSSTLPNLDQLNALIEKTKTAKWYASDPMFIANRPLDLRGGSTNFDVPTVLTWCSKCNQRYPFNPKFAYNEECPGQATQGYCVGFECQGCKDSNVSFLVRREDSKLILCGRAPMEPAQAPTVLPKKIAVYYANAQVAHNAGQTLAGLFLLRVFIEQFWRTTQQVAESLMKGDGRLSGDEMGSIYLRTLPSDFTGRFPSLSHLYEQLSSAIHTASADEALFATISERIIEHFEARRIFRISDT